jgi:2-oxoglutarate ferredoxin oxidoreductase subunit delta
MAYVVVDEESCKGCGLCVAFCEFDVLRVSQRLNQAGHHPVEIIEETAAACTGCARCALMCPDVAITVYR